MARRSRTNVYVGSASEWEALRDLLRPVAPWLVVFVAMPIVTATFRRLWGENPTFPALLLGSSTIFLCALVLKVTHNRSMFARRFAVFYMGAPMTMMTVTVHQGLGNRPTEHPLFVLWVIGGLAMCIAWNVRYRKREDDDFEIDIPKPKAVPAAKEAAAIEGGKDKALIEAEAAKAAEEIGRAHGLEVVKSFKILTSPQGPLDDLHGARIKVVESSDYRTDVRVRLKGERGHTPKMLTDARPLFATKMQVGEADVRVSPNPRNNADVLLRVVWIDQLADSIPWDGPRHIGKSVAAAGVDMSVYEDMVPGELFLPFRKLKGGETQQTSHLLTEGMNGSGKALALDTPVPTPAGWSTMEELKTGDVVFDEHGQPTRVTHAWDVRYGRPCYEITFSDGSTIVADGDHQWKVDTHASRIADANQRAKAARRGDSAANHCGFPRYTWPQVVTTDEMAGRVRVRGGRHVNYSVRVAGAIHGAEADLPIPPYTLGAWLGDGTSAAGAITCYDHEIIEEIVKEGETVTLGVRRRYLVGGLTTRLRKTGLLGNKHIPVAYLRASRDQRRALLAGLLDTDGTCTKSGTVEFVSTRQRLAREVFHLAASLGYKPRLRQKPARLYGKDCGTAWTVSFTTADKVFRLPRKLARQVATVRASAEHRYITSIRPVPSVPVRCIAVDSPSHLFLVGEACIPTHNSEAAKLCIADWCTRKDTLIWGIDVGKGLQTMKAVAPALDWFADDKATARAMVQFLRLLIPARGTYMIRNGYDNWVPECFTKLGLPFHILNVEEGALIFEGLGKAFPEVMYTARSVGVSIWGSIQRAQHEGIDPNARAQFSQTLTFGVSSDEDVFVMPEEMKDAGCAPQLWRNKRAGMHYHNRPDVDFDRLITPLRAKYAPEKLLTEVVGSYWDQFLTTYPDEVIEAAFAAARQTGANDLIKAFTDRRSGGDVMRAAGMDVPGAATVTAEVAPDPAPARESTTLRSPARAPAATTAAASPTEAPHGTHVDGDRLGEPQQSAADYEDVVAEFLGHDDTDPAPAPAGTATRGKVRRVKEGGSEYVVDDDGTELELEDLHATPEELVDEDIQPPGPFSGEIADGELGEHHGALAATLRPQAPEDVIEFPPDDDEPISDRQGAQQALLMHLASKGPGFVFQPATIYDALPTVGRSKSWIRTEVVRLAERGDYVEKINDPTSPDDGKYRTTPRIGEYASGRPRVLVG